MKWDRRHVWSSVALLGLAILALGSTDTSTTQQTSPRASTQKWYQGGTLHKATLDQWRAASYRNKLATAGDWLSATTWKGHLNSPSDFDRLKVKAAKLVKAVDGSIEGVDIPEQSITEIAAALITVANDLGP